MAKALFSAGSAILLCGLGRLTFTSAPYNTALTWFIFSLGGIVILGAIVTGLSRKMSAKSARKAISQETRGSQSPVIAVGTIGNVGAGATLSIGSQHHVHSSLEGAVPYVDRPVLVLAFKRENLKEVGNSEQDFITIRNIGERPATAVKLTQIQRGPYIVDFEPINVLVAGDPPTIVAFTVYREGNALTNSDCVYPAEGFRHVLEYESILGAVTNR